MKAVLLTDSNLKSGGFHLYSTSNKIAPTNIISINNHSPIRSMQHLVLPPAEDEAQVIGRHGFCLDQCETVLTSYGLDRLDVTNSPERVSRLERRIEGDIALHHEPVHPIRAVGKHANMLISYGVCHSEEGVGAFEWADMYHVDADDDVYSPLPHRRWKLLRIELKDVQGNRRKYAISHVLEIVMN